MYPDVYLSSGLVFSGDDGIEARLLQRSGCKHRCFSFAFVDKVGKFYNASVVNSLKVCEKKKVSIMMDSGAHTLHKITDASKRRGKGVEKKQEVDIFALQKDMFKRYVEFCKAHQHKWTFYVTLDFAKHQPTIYAMQKRFKAEGLVPVPVYHGDSSLDWLKKYVDFGVDFFCIGSVLRSHREVMLYLEQVFNYGEKVGLKFHGLAFTSLYMMTRFPWKSVDSSTWGRAAAFGEIVFPDLDDGSFYRLHISEKGAKQTASYNLMSKKHREKIDEVIQHYGFDAELLRKDHIERHIWNAFVFSNLNTICAEYALSPSRHVRWGSLL